MSKYHITKSGKPAKCRAVIKPCPLGTHYATEQEAYDSLQSQMSEEYGVLSSVNLDERSQVVELEKAYKSQCELVKKGKFKSREEEEFERDKLARIAKSRRGNDSEVENMSDLLKDLKEPDAGATISISTTNNKRAIVPTVGFCASPYPEYSKVFNSAKEINHKSILEFMDNVEKNNKGIFLEKDIYIGLWNDPSSGKVYLDLSKRYHSAKDARIACEQNDQIAYFDLQVFESVVVDKNAKSGQKW